MKNFKVVFIKVQTFAINQKNQVVQLAELEIKTNKEKFDIPVPAGYAIMTVTEILESIRIIEPEVKPFYNEQKKLSDSNN
jgi:hypothetical protein